MFKTRLISGIVLVIIALVTIISGSYLLWGTLFLVSLIGLTELYRAAGRTGKGLFPSGLNRGSRCGFLLFAVTIRTMRHIV